MADEKIASIMREFVKTLGKEDIEKTLSYFTEDGVWVNPDGTMKGKEELRRYLTVMSESMQDVTVTETGNGIIVQGNKAFFEHVIAGKIKGKRAGVLAICAYEFSGDKIKEIRTTYDRLSMAEQAATGLGKWMVNLIVKQTEKGLR